MQTCQHLDNTKRLLQTILSAVKRDTDYFISGSLSFLPLLDFYRLPGFDIDFSIEKSIFSENKDILKGDGYIRRVPLNVIPIAKTNAFLRYLALPTNFFHIVSSNGLLDMTLFSRDRHGNYHMPILSGISLFLPKEIEQRFRTLTFMDISYRAAPLEFAILPKLISYLKKEQIRSKDLSDIEATKHIIDYEFTKFLLETMTLSFAGISLPNYIRTKYFSDTANDIQLLGQFQRTLGK
jgi:hypothetical protein